MEELAIVGFPCKKLDSTANHLEHGCQALSRLSAAGRSPHA